MEFEKPILELEKKISDLRTFSAKENIDVSEEIKSLQIKLKKIKKEIFLNLSASQKVRIARHPKRPYSADYISRICEDFAELHGDRRFSDDKAIIGGLAKIGDIKIMFIGHQKGRDTKENLMRNFGSAHPEGYRKALRLMKIAEKLQIPILTFIDTPGAYPGVGAEERGQAEAIAVNLREMPLLKTPIMCVVIGEGGSGGALGIGVGDRVLILQNAYYSVISPEGCAAILWKDRAKTQAAAEALKLTAKDLLALKVVDEVIPEPLGGAHRDYDTAAEYVKKAIVKNLTVLGKIPVSELVENRYKKFRKLGVYKEEKNENRDQKSKNK
ncbi:MAG: acetyl-CoA carboxylase carboxyltransferase subunit alpha [Candidatus Auribacterota bacterium]|nr:acetyl-CoA carboxylase carboxyltransferase subunit alpha [Candidatus Auribacterota bacterium]